MFASALKRVARSRIPFLVGGAYAFQRYTGIPRHSRDLDLFVRERDVERTMDMFRRSGYRTELTFPHWLGKIYSGRTTVDIIFNSGNGICRVDDSWFEHAREGEVLGQPVRLCPVEEMIWSKAFIMERERFDGADVLHLLLATAPELDWDRLLERFASHRLVLIAHLTLFLFVYPGEAWRIPDPIWARLIADLERERRVPRDAARICRGTLVSRSQYLTDAQDGYRDVRLPPDGGMSHDDVATWTHAAAGEIRSGVPGPLVKEHARQLRDAAEPAADPGRGEGRRRTARPRSGSRRPGPARPARRTAPVQRRRAR